MTLKKRVAVLISGRGSNMRSLLEACRDPDFPAELALVLSNRPDAPGLASAKAEGVATAAVDHKIYSGRTEFEASLQRVLELHRIDLICLAGFMRMLTPQFVEAWDQRILNIHPALLPGYRGLNTHERALADGVRIHGCTVHFVTAGVDEGPIIAQAAVSVMDDDTPETLGSRVLEQEHRIYPLALRIVASGRARLEGRRVLIRGAMGESPALLSPAPRR
jgi:phosphoribosylglycinamide formyltransferase-1